MTLMLSRPSPCTEIADYRTPGTQHPGRNPLRRRRGTAEIELMLSILVFISLLLLVRGAMKIGSARLANVQDASFQAFRNAVTDWELRNTDESGTSTVDGFVTVREGLPNRAHVPRPTGSIQVTTGEANPFDVRYGASASVIAPPWSFSAYPLAGQDLAETKDWFENFAEQGRTSYASSLGLDLAWKP